MLPYPLVSSAPERFLFFLLDRISPSGSKGCDPWYRLLQNVTVFSEALQRLLEPNFGKY